MRHVRPIAPRIALVIGTVVAAVALTGCSMVATVLPGGNGGLRTYSVDPGTVCNAGKRIGGVGGRLQVQPVGSAERVRLLTDDGQVVSVAWPAGSRLTIAEPSKGDTGTGPRAIIRNRYGDAIAKEGTRVDIGVPWGSADGTYDSPYLVDWDPDQCSPTGQTPDVSG